MSRWSLAVAVALAALILVATRRHAVPSAPAEPGIREASESTVEFLAFDVFIDPRGHPLAVYQIDLRQTGGRTTGVARIVGIEGGEVASFSAAPYFDPRAIQSDRVMLGAIANPLGADLPTERVRVARIHVMVEGASPQWDIKVQAVADAGGTIFTATGSVERTGAAQGTN